MSQSIVFTGGGTAGHVTPNVAIIDALHREGWRIAYMGSSGGIEEGMIKALGVPFYPISSGKLRRYFSFKNLLDPFKIIVGVIQSFRLFRRLKPDVVFSKGGFVAFPVVIGAWLNHIPVAAHESDMSPGLANRLSFPFVNIICLTFEPTKGAINKSNKIQVTGTPIRPELFLGNRTKGLEYCGFDESKPCLLVIGGSMGAASINRTIRETIHQLTQQFQVIHVCGKGKLDIALNNMPGYRQFEFVNEELPDIFAAATIVISRAGANSLYEILALAKPHILIPLSIAASRGDQIQNARYFQQKGVSVVIQDEALNPEHLLEALKDVLARREAITRELQALNIQSATEKIVSIIKEM
jgi:UDP-N-acetylglucosamine--N-acetylmuramyl-(pentapeptide) pyrophosphoryl-undecaprenol N-acetylglucosamine transferase